MGLLLTKDLENNCKLGVWELTEDAQELKSILSQGKESFDFSNLATITNQKRKLEWLAEHALLKKLLNKNLLIHHDENGKPLLETAQYNISISHSNELVSIIYSPDKIVGLDIEQISDKIGKVALKFLHAKELEYVESDKDVFMLYLHWCAKETLYKMYSKKKLSFVRNLRIEPFEVKEAGKFSGSVIYDSQKETYELNYFKIKDYVLVWSCK